jgi:putative lipoic acid-binding regulatory protein
VEKLQPIHSGRHLNQGGSIEYSFEDSDLPDRKVANTKSIAEYQKQLSKLDIETRDKTSKLLDDTHDNCSDLMLELSEINKTAKTQHDEQLTENGAIFSGELKIWATEKNKLETLYKEDLKLRPAANYWKKAAAKHERLAVLASCLLAVVAFISIAAISSFFYKWVETFGNPEFKPASLQGVLMFAVIIAIIAFVLKILSRIIFSSIHLSRDAEEREQLTYFYLALRNESEMSETDRTLVLTSLFSRAETGLLTNEHGPTLPIADAFKSMNK